MANFNSDVITAKNANKLHNQPQGRKQRYFAAKYTAATIAAGSTVTMLVLPAGFTPVRGKLVTDALGSGVTIAVGDGTTANKYLAATVCNTAGLHTELGFGADSLPGSGLAADTTIVLTTAGAAATGNMGVIVEGYMPQD